MKTQKILPLLLVVLAVAIVILFFTKKDAAGKLPPLADPLNDGNNDPVYPNNPNTSFPLKKGSSGKAVKLVQIVLGVTPDGIFGENTLQALKTLLNKETVTEQDFEILCVSPGGNDFPLLRGSQNNWVKAIQVAFDLTPDGIFGPKTEEAVERFLLSKIVTKDDYLRIINTYLNTSFV